MGNNQLKVPYKFEAFRMKSGRIHPSDFRCFMIKYHETLVVLEQPLQISWIHRDVVFKILSILPGSHDKYIKEYCCQKIISETTRHKTIELINQFLTCIVNGSTDPLAEYVKTILPDVLE